MGYILHIQTAFIDKQRLDADFKIFFRKAQIGSVPFSMSNHLILILGQDNHQFVGSQLCADLGLDLHTLGHKIRFHFLKNRDHICDIVLFIRFNGDPVARVDPFFHHSNPDVLQNRWHTVTNKEVHVEHFRSGKVTQ